MSLFKERAQAQSHEEAIAGVQAFCAQRYSPSRAARVMEEAMMAITAGVPCVVPQSPAEIQRGSGFAVRAPGSIEAGANAANVGKNFLTSLEEAERAGVR